MRVLATGSAGFIGAATSVQLEASGHEVVRGDALLLQANGPEVDGPYPRILDTGCEPQHDQNPDRPGNRGHFRAELVAVTRS